MSDDDESFDVEDSEDEEEEEEGAGGLQVQIENAFYESEAQMQDGASEPALEGFKRVLKLEGESGEKSEFGFMALKHIVQLTQQLGKESEVLDNYKKLLTYTESNVITRNESEKGINSTLDGLTSKGASPAVIQQIYSITLEALLKADNQKLWFKTLLKLGNVYLQTKELAKLEDLIKEAHKACQLEDGSVDPSKSGQYLEVNALEISMYTELNERRKLEEVYEQSRKLIASVVVNSKVLGIIQECGGKMFMRSEQWEEANKCFFDAFTNYNDAGDPRKIQCLKYRVLSTMLQESDVDPMGAPETAPFKTNPEIAVLMGMATFQRKGQLKDFENMLNRNKHTIMNDSFTASTMPTVLRKLRVQVLQRIVKPYSRIDLKTLCDNLFIDEEEVMELLVSQILDGRINGRIDMVNKRLVLLGKSAQSDQRYNALDRWMRQISSTHSSVIGKVH